MVVYIVLGDTPRSDGDNIEGVFYKQEDAKALIEFNKKYHPYTEYSIEEFDVE